MIRYIFRSKYNKNRLKNIKKKKRKKKENGQLGISPYFSLSLKEMAHESQN